MRPWADRDRGFTLAEVLVATVVLSASVVAAAGLFVMAARSRSVARAHTWATILAADKLEQLRSLHWTFDAASDVGLRPSPGDTLAQDVSGYVDYLDAAGRWVAGGAVPPADATWIRRWCVQPLNADPADTIVIQVVVIPVGARVANGNEPPGAARLATVRTRKRVR